MQKVIDFLEKNVQWLVLGLGGIVLLMMAWTYLIQPPVSVKIGDKSLVPGAIDEQTVQGPVAEFKRKLGIGDIDLALPDPNYADGFEGKAVLDKVELVVLERLVPSLKPEASRTVLDGPEIVAAPSRTVKELPQLAAATHDAGNNGRSVIMLPDPKKKKSRPNEQVAVQNVDMIKVDKDWVTQAFEIDVEKLGEEYKRIFDGIDNLPPNVYETQIVYVELIREEKLPDGKWGNRKSINPLSIHEQPAFPDVKDMQKSLEYNMWAMEHPELITTPPFYQTSETGGDSWTEPGSEVMAVVAPTPATPAVRQPRPYGGMPSGFGRGPYPGAYGGGAGRGRRPPGYAMQDGGRPGYPPGYGGYGGGGGRSPYPGMYGGGRSPYPGMYGGGGMYGRGYPGMYPGMQQPAGPTENAAGPGSFNVNEVNVPIRVWAHDDTVEAGKTYHYAIHYYIRSPLFQTTSLAEPKELAERYAIKSPLSDWSDQVKITPKVAFFLASIGKERAKFEVFTWQKGNWKKKTIDRAPGDLIPDTTWTIVDQRKDGGDSYVLLVNQGGTIQRREAGGDRKTPMYLDLNGKVEAAKGATAAAASAR